MFLGYVENENLMKPNQRHLTVTAKDPQNGCNFEKGENTNKSLHTHCTKCVDSKLHYDR